MAVGANKITQEDILALLDKLYVGAVEGINKVCPPISQLAKNYLDKEKDIQSAAMALIHNQTIKCATSGFLSGLGGVITLPIAIPANIGSVLYVQLRMIAALAYMAGYDPKSDQVQTLVYACLAGVSVDQIIKKAAIEFGERTLKALINKIPGTTLTKINKKVGTRFLTKFGEKGIINLGNMVPVVSGVIGGSFDLVETKIIAKRAYNMFIMSDFSFEEDEDVEVIDVEFVEVDSNHSEEKGI